jgi:hypothetical protein
MRTTFIALAGICLLTPSFVQAQAKPQTPPATSAAAQTPAAERKEIKLSPKVLQTYAGEYDFQPGRVLTVTLEDGYLWGQPTDQAKRQMFPESETKFFLKDLDAQVTFQKEKGKVVGLLLQQEGRPDRELKKIK